MPFYEYECSHCKFYVEALQKISDPPLIKCPSCGKQTLKRLVSAPNFRLKGSGWYETDFKSDKENKRNIAGAEDAPATDSKESEESKSVRAPRKAGGTGKGRTTVKKKAIKKVSAKGSGATRVAKKRGKVTKKVIKKVNVKTGAKKKAARKVARKK
jgi:putative FmdB family regulatory protein